MISPLRLFLALLLAQAVAAFAQSPADNTTVVVINGEPVSADEYALVMRRRVALVHAHFKQARDLDDHAGYWSPDSGPDGPLAKLRELTLAELVRIKVHQIEARNRGFMRDIDFAAYRAAYEKENARRLAAKAAGEVVYGPSRYRFDVYYHILLGDVVHQVERALARELAPSVVDAEIDAFLAEHRTAFSEASEADARRRAVEILGERKALARLDALRASAKVEIFENALNRVVPRLDPPPRS